MTPRSTALDRLARLLAFPRQDVAPLARECATALAEWYPEAADAVASFSAFAARTPLSTLQEAYTATFDFDPDCSLELGWHLFGETFQRGEFLVWVREDLTRAGVEETEGLPDHLSHVLSLLALEEPSRARALASRVAPAVETVRAALSARQSPYVDLLASSCAVLERIGGSPAGSDDDPQSMDRPARREEAGTR